MVTVRKFAKDFEAEPGGAVMFRPGDLDLGKGSDQAQAALLLAKAGDRPSAAAIRALAAKATGADKEVLDQAVQALK